MKRGRRSFVKKLNSIFILIFVLVILCLGEGVAEKASRPIHTYSIVARDPDTGQLGVAVQSHWFSGMRRH